MEEVMLRSSELNNRGKRFLEEFVSDQKSKRSSMEIKQYFGTLLKAFPAAPIRFIKFEDMVNLKTMPRYPDNESITVDLLEIDRSSSLLVFISHCWMRGDSSADGWDGSAHPDNAAGDKYKLCIDGISRMKKLYAPRMKNCYVWLDFGCMNQNCKTLSSELEHYDRIVQSCDCIFTPIVDPDHETWEFPCLDPFKDYGAKLWNVGPHSYLNRAWCRVEMLYAANIPVLDNEGEGCVKRHTMFEAGLAFHCSQNRRPHFLFGTKQMKTDFPPLLLSPLQHSYLVDYHPLKGFLTRESDMEYIGHLISLLKPLMDANEVTAGYSGDLNANDEKHGRGVMTYENGDVYDGEWQNDKRHGQGVLKYPNGAVYDGEWVADKMCGVGTFKSSDCVEYNGQWKDNLRHGRGTFKNSSGGVYEGEWVDDLMHGHGVFRCSDGGVYDGKWVHDKMHGYGVHIYGNGDVYKGYWQNGQKHGHGVFDYESGDFYVGQWSEDMMDGSGTRKSVDGSFYKGEWKMGNRHGCGVYQSKFEFYEGEWKDGKRHSHGKFTFSDGTVYEGEWKNGIKHGHGKAVYPSGNVYDGEWKNGKRHGHGKYLFLDGEVYEGEYLDDKRNGHGKVVCPNGGVYEGEWKDGMEHGHGKYTFPDGEMYEGEWKDGKEEGHGKYTLPDGEIYEGEWKDGNRHGHGKCTFPDGLVYEGDWRDDIEHGHGKYTFPDGAVYE